MEGRARQARYCSHTCKQYAYYDRRPDAHAQIQQIAKERTHLLSVGSVLSTTPRVCEWCGGTFLAKQHRSRFCSRACARNSDPARTWNQRRRAIIKGDPDAELINRDEIAARDGWRCGICLKAIDRERRHPDLLSASLDHIVPLAKGGKHVRANVQIAHLRCNLRKGDRAPDVQVLLIG